jgi:hypothetical protein
MFLLMDLKQKEANLSEAHYARIQAEQSVEQGRTLILFTLITIIL